MKLHADWPEYTGRWDSTNPHSEIQSGLEDYPTFATAAAPSAKADPIALSDMESVTAYYLAEGGTVWHPGDYIGTEIEFVIKGTLKDGRWFSGTLWNDYTGWGCQSGADFRVAATEAEVDAYGLDKRERELLGIADPTSGSDRRDS